MRAIKVFGNPDGYRWYVLETRRHRESDTEFGLRKHGFSAYVPRIIQWPPPADGGHVGAMFPGFVFVQLRLANDYAKIIDEPGVKSLMTFGKEPTIVPDEAIDFLRSCERPDGVIRCGISALSGNSRGKALRALSDIVEKQLSSKKRIEALMSVLRSELRIEMAEEWSAQ